MGVEFSTDGVSYVSFGNLSLNTSDTAFTKALGAGPSQQAFVRLSFPDPANGQAIIDNVTIWATTSAIPEPSTAAMLLLGLTGLAITGRRRA